MAKTSRSEKVPKQMNPIFDAITEMTDKICAAHLDQEYAELARQATAALCRKRPSPLSTGHVDTWACGIVYALGYVNFLFDKSQTPSMTAAELCEAFGVKKSTGASKSKAVRQALNMQQMDPEWYRPSQMNDNPLAWNIMLNGYIVDARFLPRELQEIALAKGLIPHIVEPQDTE